LAGGSGLLLTAFGVGGISMHFKAAAARAEPMNPQTVVPDTPAGRRLLEWLAAFNSGDFETASAFQRDSVDLEPPTLPDGSHPPNWPPPDLARTLAIQDVLMQPQTGGFDLHAVSDQRSSDDEIVAVLQARLTEVWDEVTLRVRPEPPNRVAWIGLRPTPRPADVSAPGRLTESEQAADLASFLDRLAAADVFSGAVLLARAGQPLLDRAYGLADRDAARPNRTDTKFNLGSMNKMFTAVAVGQLVEQGKLGFSDTVARLLPDQALPGADRITVHHLLTHTSGLGDYFGPRFFEGGKDQLRTVWDYFPLFQDAPLAFEPGSKWSYSNAGFVVLGAIIERISAMDYFEHVRRNLYAPAGMHDTDAYERDQPVPNLAVGYTNMGPTGLDLGPPQPNTPTLPLKGGPAGGGYSTTGDLARFAEALLGSRLLGPEMTETLTTGKVETGMAPGKRYGYGFIEQRVNGIRVVGHDGGAPGISAGLEIYPDLGCSVAVLANVDFGAEAPRRRARELLTA
jgi:CubicO group peptidase (beta-lactamase class C family)